MSSKKDIKKDPRRINLVVAYRAPAPSKDKEGSASSAVASFLPMAAMLSRNRFVGWGALIMSIVNWLGESEETRSTSSTPGFFSVGMALMALVVTYLPMFLPDPANRAAAAATPAPVTVA